MYKNILIYNYILKTVRLINNIQIHKKEPVISEI